MEERFGKETRQRFAFGWALSRAGRTFVRLTMRKVVLRRMSCLPWP